MTSSVMTVTEDGAWLRGGGVGVGAGGDSDRSSSWHSESEEQSKTVASGST